ncbi:flagellin [Yersinia sp. Marseille-Q3913]|uniref:flagellin n=1 Tax=Yersinia sp. Marseille-Q3913 TaxID=2830769 RepID=UPI001BB025B4|nr:flagellin [Yersinia sp. Marseille-Q3913]MBS0053954.1 flagellin [Yersinia sp. Marseille-Q3913]
MAISMNTNTTAMSSTLVMDKAHSKLSASHQNMGKGTKQLSAADTQIIGKMAREVSGLKVGQTNIKKATSMLGIAQGAFQSVNDLLTQMKEKAFAATNVANGVSERAAYQEEFSSLGQQLERVFTNTTFNGEKLLAKDGKLDGKLVFQTGTQNSTPMEANFSKQLKNLMEGISAKGTKSLEAGNAGSIEKKYYDALKKVVLAEEKYSAIDALVDQEVNAAAAVAGLVAPLDAGNFDAGMRSVFTATNAVTLAGLGTFTAATVTGDDAELATNASFAAQTHNAADFATTAAKADTVTAIKGIATVAKGELTTAKDELATLKNDPAFDYGGAMNLQITDNVKSQDATVALERLALSFDEMNSQVQALMDSMQAQSEMQSTVINKTEEAIGATRDTDYMEETSNIAAAKLRNVTAMAAVKQSYEITSTIINTLVNVNN